MIIPVSGEGLKQPGLSQALWGTETLDQILRVGAGIPEVKPLLLPLGGNWHWKHTQHLNLRLPCEAGIPSGVFTSVTGAWPVREVDGKGD